MAKLIRYKGNALFDYFELWHGEDELGVEGDDVDVSQVDCMSSQVCPACTKKYGLYEDVHRKPKSIDEELEFYGNDLRGIDRTCGILNCENGAADDMYVSFKDCEIVE